MKHLLKDANGVGNYTPYVDYSGSTITFQNTIWNKVKRNLVLWYDIKRQGATNESMSQNPILKDLSGNGHDATCYNFAWKGMSGIGGYIVDFTEPGWSTTAPNVIIDKTSHSFVITKTSGEDRSSIIYNENITGKIRIKVSGLTEGNLRLSKRYQGSGNVIITEDGIYENEYNNESPALKSDTQRDSCHIKIELIPEYPNALVSDGVDDYCIVEGLPILTDYTVIAKRKRLDIDLGHRGALVSKLPLGGSNNGAFALEFSAADNAKRAISFGTFSNINFEETDISYQTKNYYNRINIQSGNQLDTDHLSLFSIRERDGCAQAALYSFVLFNRTLTEDEIKKWIRENMDENHLLPNERPEPIIYYDFRNGDNSNLNTVTDLSGNERHGTMYNFTSEANSGYSDGCLKFNGIDNYIEIPYSDDAVYKTVIFLIRPSLSKSSNMIYDARYNTGFTTGISLYYTYSGNYLSGRLSDNAKVYINGAINTSYTNRDMDGKKNCVAVSDDVLYSGNLGGPPNIGTVRFASGWFSDMELYAFLGFDKILTEEEIRYVMNKYNLLEGIDEI